MTRLYLKTTIENTKEIWKGGFWNIHGRDGVYFSSEPPIANDVATGEVVLCLEIPEELFREYEIGDVDDCRMALIPSEALNKLGKPQVYDHFFAGLSRGRMVKTRDRLEGADVLSHQHAEKFKEAMKFFDEIGWQTPLRLREENEVQRP